MTGDDDDDDYGAEVLRRLMLLDRKLNYLTGFALAGMGAAVMYIVHNPLKEFIPDPWALLVAICCGYVAAQLMERHFRSADP